MLTSLPISLLVGLILGFLAGLGVGGGSLLILWLTVLVGFPHETARSINLLFFITAAGAVSLFRWKKGVLDIKTLLPAILSGCITAGAASFIRSYIELEMLKKLFGVLLIFTGLRELFYRPRKAR